MRRERLIILIDNLGVGAKSALPRRSALPLTMSLACSTRRARKEKGISGDMARRIEQYFAVQIGWLDGLEQTGLRPARKKAAQAPGKRCRCWRGHCRCLTNS